MRVALRLRIFGGALVLCFAWACSSPARKESSISRIAFGSCAFQWEPQPIWDRLLVEEPDLFLFLGDCIYGDWDGEKVFDVTETTLARDWGRLGDRPEFQRFRQQVPVLATWDNHDYGRHDGGAGFTKKELTKRFFLDFFGEPSGTERRLTPGIYDARVFGPPGRRVQVVLLDLRTFRGPLIDGHRSKAEWKRVGAVGPYLPNHASDATLLGEAQWRWLEEQLQRPADLRIIASGTQIVSDQKGMQEWGNVPGERRRLFDLIAKTGARGVIFLSGNVHFAELSRSDEGPYPLFDFTSSGLTHVNAEYATARNRRRVGQPVLSKNAGMVEVDWDAEGGPTVTFSVLTLDDPGVPPHKIRLDLLR